MSQRKQNKESEDKICIQSISALLKKTFNNVKPNLESNKPLGVPSGFHDLDDLISGFQPGELAIIASRTGIGKSCLLMNIASYMAIREQYHIYYAHIESNAQSFLFKLLSSLTMIPIDNIYKGRILKDSFTRLNRASEILKHAPIFVDDTASVDLYELIDKIYKFFTKNDKKSVIMIDYLQRITIKNKKFNNRYEELSEVARELKNVAMDCNIPIIACSQLNRKLEDRDDKRPILNDLRDTGCLEEEADLILFIYRDEIYYDEVDNEKPRKKELVEIIVPKNRRGYTGRVRMSFIGEYMAFENFNSSYYIS